MISLLIVALAAIGLSAYVIYTYAVASREKEAQITSLVCLGAGGVSIVGAIAATAVFFAMKPQIVDKASQAAAQADFLFALKLGAILTGVFSLILFVSLALSPDFRMVRGIITPLFVLIVAMVGYGASVITAGGNMCSISILCLCMCLGGILFLADAADLHMLKRKLSRDDEFRRSRAFKAAKRQDSAKRRARAKSIRKEIKNGSKK